MMRRAGARQRLFRTPPQEPLHAAPFGANLRQPEAGGAGARDDNEVDARREQARPGPEALAAESLDPVSSDGPSDRSSGHDAEARREGLSRLRRYEQREVRRADATTEPLRLDEFGVFAQPPVFAKA
jgi:hypothetical protein